MNEYTQDWGDIAYGEKTGAVLCAHKDVGRLSEYIKLPLAQIKQLLLPLRCNEEIPEGSTLWNRVDLFKHENESSQPELHVEDIFTRLQKPHWRSAGLLLDCPDPEKAEWFEQMSHVFQAEFSEIAWRTQVAVHVFQTKYQRLLSLENQAGLRLPETGGAEAYQCFVYEPPKPGQRKKDKTKPRVIFPSLKLQFPKKEKKVTAKPKKELKIPAVTDVIRTGTLRPALHAVYKGTCQMCHRHDLSLEEMEVDHIIPVTIPLADVPNLLIEQGLKPELLDSFVSMLPPQHHSAANYQPVCGLCNSQKSNKLLASGNLELRLRTARERAEEVLQWYARRSGSESPAQRYLFVDE